MKRNGKIVVVVAGVCVVALVVVLTSTRSIRQHFYERAYFSELVEPFTVTRAVEYTDGGTIGVTVQGAEGGTLAFCVDGRSIVDENGRDANPTHHRLFLGVWHSESDGAFLTARGGYAEKRITQALTQWLDSPQSRKARRPRSIDDPRERRGRDDFASRALLEGVLEHLRDPSPGRGSGPFDGLGRRPRTEQESNETDSVEDL